MNPNLPFEDWPLEELLSKPSVFDSLDSDQRDALRKTFAQIATFARSIRDVEDVRGYRALLRVLRNAKNDPEIANSAQASKFLESVIRLMGTSLIGASADEIFEPVRRDGVSRSKRDIARSKNKKARAWVVGEWATRIDKEQGYASFGRQYALLVKKKFQTDVKPGTIARDWLPKR